MDTLTLSVILGVVFFSILTVLVKDNVYSAVFLSLAAALVAVVYALMEIYHIVFLILVVYIGAVILLVLIVASTFRETPIVPSLEYRLGALAIALIVSGFFTIVLMTQTPILPPPTITPSFIEINKGILSSVNYIYSLVGLFIIIVMSLIFAIQLARRGERS